MRSKNFLLVIFLKANTSFICVQPKSVTPMIFGLFLMMKALITTIIPLLADMVFFSDILLVMGCVQPVSLTIGLLGGYRVMVAQHPGIMVVETTTLTLDTEFFSDSPLVILRTTNIGGTSYCWYVISSGSFSNTNFNGYATSSNGILLLVVLVSLISVQPLSVIPPIVGISTAMAVSTTTTTTLPIVMGFFSISLW